MTRPVGWPDRLPDPQSPEFASAAVDWLLDLGPGEWRTLPGLRECPPALALRASCEIQGRLEAARTAYAGLRTSLADVVGPEEVERALGALEAEGAGLLARQREVALVEEALRGRRWRARM